MTTQQVDSSSRFVDGWNLSRPTTTSNDGILNAIHTSENDRFSEYNTTLTVENGLVMEINRRYALY